MRRYLRMLLIKLAFWLFAKSGYPVQKEIKDILSEETWEIERVDFAAAMSKRFKNSEQELIRQAQKNLNHRASGFIDYRTFNEGEELVLNSKMILLKPRRN